MSKELDKMQEVFEEIYLTKKWVKGRENPASLSGPGSFPEAVEKWMQRLEIFLKEKNISSVVDYGCGDFAVYKNFDWMNIKYTGIDISQHAIDLAKRNAPSTANFNFICDKTFDLPSADLLIIKDVLGHWNGLRSTRDLGDKRYLITDFLSSNMNKFKFVLIVDAIHQVIEDYFPKKFQPVKEILPFGGTKDKKSLYIYTR